MMHNNSISTPRVARIHRASTRTTRPHSCALSRYEHAVASHLDLVLLVQLLTVFLPFAVCFNQLKQQQSARVCVCLTSWPYLSLMQASRGYELALIHGDGPNLGRRVKHPLFLIDRVVSGCAQDSERVCSGQWAGVLSPRRIHQTSCTSSYNSCIVEGNTWKLLNISSDESIFVCVC